MDGRTFRQWCALGCLIAAAGCNRNAKQQQNLIGPMPAGTGAGTPMVNMPLTTAKSMWGGSSGPTVPVEVTDNSNKPASAAALVAIADVRLESAFGERTAPGSKEGLLDLARLGYQKALQQEPKSKAALAGAARYYARVGDREQAVEMYKRYLTLYPEAEIAHEVAVAHGRWKDWAGAASWCEYALNIDPENRAVKKTYGFSLAFAGRWDEAFAALCQIMPEAQARHNLAGLLDHMGRPDASKTQLQMAVKADPNYAPAVGFLAELSQPQSPNGVRQASEEYPAQ